jgi:hypothetical protein
MSDGSTIVVVFYSSQDNPAHGRGILQSLKRSGFNVAYAINSEHADKYAVEEGEVMVFVLEKRR